MKTLASGMTSKEIEKYGIELIPEKWQEDAILKKIREIVGNPKETKENLLTAISNLIKNKLILFSSHAEFERMPDPVRNCRTKETAIARLITVGKIRKFKANVIEGTNKIRNKLSYTTESELDRGKLAIRFTEDKRILIITIL